MASTGYFYSRYADNGGRWKISWEIISQDEYSNTSTIGWKITTVDGAGYFGNFYLAIDGDKLMAWSDRVPLVSSYCIKIEEGEIEFSGEYDITHNSDGGASFTFNFIYCVDSISNEYLINKSFTLTPFPKIATVTSTNAYLGDNITITIGKQSASSIFTYSLSYTFGKLSGTISSSTTNTTTTWTVPTTFYGQMPDAASKSGVITCTTYRDGVVEGTSTCTFTAMINPDSCKPTLTPTVKDIKPETLALTGDENIIIRNASMVEYAFNALAWNEATIANYVVQCGNKKVTGLPQGVIDDAESGTFIFTVTDSRGFTSSATIEKPYIDYVKLTCNQDIKILMSEENTAQAKVTISGNYFNGNFGSLQNELKIEMRHTQNDGEMGDWVELTNGLIPVFNGNTYSLEITISGFSYSQSYTFQCRATDRLNYVETSEYTTRVLPIFDWSRQDFNFNVPVNIEADNLNMHGETVLRHNTTANNTVLSGSGGHIYLRPGGTTDTSSEVRISSTGDIELTGDIIINGVSLITALQEAGIL